MRKRKLFILLSILSEEDWKELEIFLSNKHFNNNKILLPFLALWKNLLFPYDPENDPEVEEFLKGSGISPGRMDKLCTQLRNLVIDFLARKEFGQDRRSQEEMYLRALQKRNAGNQELTRNLKSISRSIGKEKMDSWQDLHLLKLRWLCAESAIKSRDTRTLWKEDFKDLHELLDSYYNLQKLRLATASANIKLIYNQGEKDPAKEYLDHLKEKEGFDSLSPLARCYFLAAELSSGEIKDNTFTDLMAQLNKHGGNFAMDEASELYGYALNYCIRGINQGNPDFLQHASDLYQRLLEQGLILENGMLLPQQFKNIVALNCRLSHLDWVEQFIEEYQFKLKEDPEGLAVMYNRAILAFHRQDYFRAIRHFKETIALAPDDVFYGLDARVYLWKSYFENLENLDIEEVDEMYRLYDAFRLYIDRNEKIAGTHKKHYRNFIRDFKRFMEILTRKPLEVKTLQALRNEIQEKDYISNKAWFLQKVDSVLEQPGD